jgi:hypothetical protein
MYPSIDFLERTFGHTGGPLVLTAIVLAVGFGFVYWTWHMTNGKGFPPGCNNTYRMIRPDGRTVIVGQFGIQQWT